MADNDTQPSRSTADYNNFRCLLLVVRRSEKQEVTNKIKNFRDLDVWQKGIKIVKDVYILTRAFPKEETYVLASQMKKASISIPSNIAEGFNRFQNKEYKRFLYIALGSCSELETQTEIAKELNYINDKTRKELLENIEHESRMLTKFNKKIRLIFEQQSTNN